MTGETTFDDDLARRLPLPLAQLYRRAHNAKTDLDRHNAAYCLWEAALKLLGSAAIVAYAERGEPAPELRERLENLARPALGHWWEFVRLLLPPLADAGDAGFPHRPATWSWAAAATTCPAPPASTPPSAKSSTVPAAPAPRCA